MLLITLLLSTALAQTPVPVPNVTDNHIAEALHFGAEGIESDSGIDGPPYAQQLEYFRGIAQRYPGWAELIQYGHSVLGRPLVLLKIRDPETLPNHAVVISGATHGNEYLNIADRLPEAFLNSYHASRGQLSGFLRFLKSGGMVYIVPILNPDGYDRDMRGNANGVDLNRDFPLLPKQKKNLTQPESLTLVRYLIRDLAESSSNLALAMDYHCCAPALLYPWSYTMQKLPPQDLAAHQTVGGFVQEAFGTSYRHGSTGQVLGYTPEGTTKDYYYARLGALAFTFEGQYYYEKQKLPQHLQMWDRVFHFLMDREEARVTYPLRRVSSSSLSR